MLSVLNTEKMLHRGNHTIELPTAKADGRHSCNVWVK